ncbi:hypothetical protein Hanom_Chr04g00345171 [Helianthus anomalus]
MKFLCFSFRTIIDPVFFICAVSNFSSLVDQPETKQRLAAFWALDSSVRTFKPKAKDLADTSSTTLTMSISSKSVSKFDLGDTDNIISPRSLKNELARGQSQLEPTVISTRAKTRSTRKKPSEPVEIASNLNAISTISSLSSCSCNLHGFVRINALQEKNLVDAEEKLVDLCYIAATKDKKTAQLENEVNGFEKRIMVEEIQANKVELEAAEEAKVYAARTVLQARIKMA